MGATARQAQPRRKAAPASPRREPGRPPARRPAKRPSRPEHQRPELVGLGLVALGVFLAAVLWLGWDGGVVGGKIGDLLRIVVGQAAVLVPLALLGIGGLVIARSSVVDVRPFRAGLVVLALGALLAVAGARFGLGPDGPVPRTLDPSEVDDRGGILGGILYVAVSTLLGQIGTTIVTVLLLLAGLILTTGASLGAHVRRSARVGTTAVRRSVDWAANVTVLEPAPRAERPARRPRPPVDGAVEFPDVVTERPVLPPPLPAIEPDGQPEPVSPLAEALRLEPTPPEPGPEPEEPLTADPVLAVAEAPVFRTAAHPDYRLPDQRVLKRSKQAPPASAQALTRTSEALVQTLAHFGIDANVVGQVSGPRVTRFELQLAPGTKMSRVTALKDDLAYGLATTDIRILAPIPGKQAVGVEVPNPSPNLVTLGDVVEELPPTASPLSVYLGKDISGAAVWADLARMPHILIAGTTGSGKSGCINAMLCSVLLRAAPDDVRMILIDPKRVELGPYESIPHLLTPVVTSPKRAAAVLLNVVEEMERRYERMSVMKARNLVEMNRVLEKRGEDTLPYLLVVIDELADLMMLAPQDVEDCIIRLAQKSRAVGIHLALATQRPSVDVITGMIKANVPSRIAFAVSSQTDSRVILDQGGAESLLGQGDMLFKPLGTSRLQRIQGAYVSEEEIALIVEHCRAQRDQELDETLLEAPERPQASGEDDEEGDLDPDDDPLLDKAIEVVVQAQSASVSLVQRRLRVGYTRAGRLIDMLERRGIISGYEGSKARRVLLTEADLARPRVEE
ncbi:MAG: DNA translocase FtsK 4TM domain-containing protein [Thermoleophilia bacterium]